MSEKYSSVEQQVSYGIGRQMGEQLASQPFDVDVNAVLDGVSASLKGEPPAIEKKILEQAFNQINQRIQAKQSEQGTVQAADGERFLAENASRDGITTTASGLQYEILTAGEGAKPTSASTVKTHYHGTLIDGTVFDSSVDRGEPAEFPVNGVIAGWTEALQLMAVGSKWRLYLPYQLAYGEGGAGGAIGPYAALVFDVELLEILS